VTVGTERRDLSLCIARARFSLAQSRKDIGSRQFWRNHARNWIMEGKFCRRQLDREMAKCLT
jgi:hypothetical protein